MDRTEIPSGHVLVLDENSDLNVCATRTGEILAAAFRAWDATTRSLDLLEEAGELARAILVHEGHKGGPSENVDEALCGVLVDVFALANYYGIPLATEYAQRLTALAERSNRRAR